MSSPERTGRRSFVKRAATIVGGIAVAGVGVGAGVSHRPAVAFPSDSFGGDSDLDKRVLLAYASKCGSTGEIAQAIGKRLGEAGVAVDVIPVKTVKSLDGYDAVVLGSAVRIGQWLPEAKAFLRSRQAELSRLPVAIFTVHLQAIDDSEESRQKRESYTAPLQPLVSPRARAFFAGKMDFSKLSLLERMATKMVKAPEEDRRDWDAIDAWAAKLPEALLPGGG